MRKVIAAAFVSLDGVMQAPGGPEEDQDGGFRYGGWTFHYWDDVMGKVMDKSLGEPFDLLLGRRTYDIFAAHWPRVGAGDPIADKFNAVTKYVATSSRAPLTWQNSIALHDAAAEVANLKKQDGPMLLIQGSSVLIQSLLKSDLIDEFRLMIFPVLLGGGKRLFGEGTTPTGLKLTASSVSSTGVTMNTYVRAGEVTTGSFALEQ
ncbi:MAG: dihydrofolate reductase [Gammaproteobacteria bacterium]|nr:dihydrofolate reductase [Gammaproteobacteria bacterium]